MVSLRCQCNNPPRLVSGIKSAGPAGKADPGPTTVIQGSRDGLSAWKRGLGLCQGQDTRMSLLAQCAFALFYTRAGKRVKRLLLHNSLQIYRVFAIIKVGGFTANSLSL